MAPPAPTAAGAPKADAPKAEAPQQQPAARTQARRHRGTRPTTRLQAADSDAPAAPAKSDAPAEAARLGARTSRPARPATRAAAPAPPTAAAVARRPLRRRRRRCAGSRARSASTSARCRARGPGGRITQDDVKEFSQARDEQPRRQRPGRRGERHGASGDVGPALPDFAKWGEVERKAMSGIRRKTAEHLSHAWNTIPHVTQFDKADITALEQVRKKYRAEVEKAGGNLTVTAIAAKVVASALKVFPQFNASVDAAGEAIVYKKYINVGIAVDTDERPARAGAAQRRPEEPHRSCRSRSSSSPRRPRPAS